MKEFSAGCIVRRHFTAVAVLSLICLSRVNAASYTYEVNGIDALTGFITTNCNSCVLNASDITGWSLASTSANSGLVGGLSSSGADAQILTQGSALMATPTAITFQFTPSPSSSYVGFLSGNQSINFLNMGTFASAPFMFPNGIGEIDTCNPGSIFRGGVCFSDFLATGTQPIANFKAAAAPELDPASMAGTMTLLFGALAVLRGRSAIFGRRS